MATPVAGPAASSAPSTAAPAEQSSQAQPTPAGESVTQIAEAGDSTPRPIRPIPPKRPQLPGVVGDDPLGVDPGDQNEKLLSPRARRIAEREKGRERARARREAMAADARAREGQIRDAIEGGDPGPGSALGEDQAAPAAGSEQQGKGAGTVTTSPIPVIVKTAEGEVTYDLSLPADRDRLVQTHRTLQGSHRSMRDGISQRDSAISEWQSYAQNQAAKIAALEARLSGGGGAQERGALSASVTPAPAAKIEAPAETPLYLNPEAYALVEREHGPQAARQWMLEEQRKDLQSQMDKRLEEKLSPFTQEREHREVANSAIAAFEPFAAAVDSAGAPVFPELHNPAAAEAIGKIWAEQEKQGVPRAYLLSPEGVRLVLLLFRDRYQYAPPPPRSSSANPTTSPVPAAPIQQHPAAGETRLPASSSPSPLSSSTAAALDAIAASAAGGVLPPSAGPTLREESTGNPASAFLRQFRQAGTVNPELGFSRH